MIGPNADPLSSANLPPAPEIGDAGGLMLGVQAGGQYWLIPADTLDSFELTPITPVPLTRSWFRGLAVVGSDLLGVVDLSAFTGGALTPVTSESRLLRPLGPEGCEAALLVGSVVGERRAEELTPVPGMPPDGTLGGPRLRDARGRVWHSLSLSALFSQPDFQDVCR